MWIRKIIQKKKKMTDLLTKFDIGIAIVACLLILAVIVDRTK